MIFSRRATDRYLRFIDIIHTHLNEWYVGYGVRFARKTLRSSPVNAYQLMCVCVGSFGQPSVNSVASLALFYIILQKGTKKKFGSRVCKNLT